LQIESAGGLVLLGTIVIALVIANSPIADSYEALWTSSIGSPPTLFHLNLDLREWVNAGLMTFFFFVVSLEIKREMVDGDLKTLGGAALPVIAALGGMLVPALIYLTINVGGEGVRGWAIPVATDIALVVGAMALLGHRVGRGLRSFLLTLAIADDLAAIVVIALFYGATIQLAWLAVAVFLCIAVVLLQRTRVWHIGPYAVLGVLIWFATLRSGVHATVAGVALGLLTPVRDPSGPQRDLGGPAERLQRLLHPWSSFVVIPLFALANAGVALGSTNWRASLTSPVTLGVVVGLVVGKAVGIAGFAWSAIKIGVGPPPPGLTGRQLIGGAVLGGIGFTISLFIAETAFDGSLAARAKIGILIGSSIAALAGALILRSGTAPSND
jgi:NhaA family Na+:H+ antiporter